MVLWKEFDSSQNKNQSTYIQKYRAKGILTYNIEEIVGRAGSGIIYFWSQESVVTIFEETE